MTSDAAGNDAAAGSSDAKWTPRELELLAVTLRLLQERGYDRLTVEAVAVETNASKSTIYRRWPSKAALVKAAFLEGTRLNLEPPDTGSLRSDLLALGEMACAEVRKHAPTMSAVLSEFSRNPEMSADLKGEFVRQRRSLVLAVFTNAANRGEMNLTTLSPDLWDIMTGYLTFRIVLSGRPPTEATVVALVDQLMMPSLTRMQPQQ